MPSDIASDQNRSAQLHITPLRCDVVSVLRPSTDLAQGQSTRQGVLHAVQALPYNRYKTTMALGTRCLAFCKPLASCGISSHTHTHVHTSRVRPRFQGRFDSHLSMRTVERQSKHLRSVIHQAYGTTEEKHGYQAVKSVGLSYAERAMMIMRNRLHADSAAINAYTELMRDSHGMRL